MARYRGEEPPEDGYQGAYMIDLADAMRAELGDDVAPDRAREWGLTAVVAQLRSGGHTYERDGAEWIATEALGDQRDRVLVRANGSTTYLLNDYAYHRDKFARGWDHLIDIWGADHHGQVKSLQVGMRALGYGTADAPEPE